MYFICFKQKTAYEMRISDWSSDVCSSDLPVQMLSRAFIAKVRLPAHDQDRPMFAVSRPYGKATLDQLPARAIQSRAAGVNVLLQGQVRLRQGQTSKLAADIIGGFGKAGETNPRR